MEFTSLISLIIFIPLCITPFLSSAPFWRTIFDFSETKLKKKVEESAQSVKLKPADWTRDLDIVKTADLNVNNHIKAVIRSAYCHLRTIWRIKRLVSGSGKLDREFIFSRLDGCNGVFTGPCNETITRLQLTHDATARVLAKTERVDHVRLVPGSLHWPPEGFRAKTQLRSAATSWPFQAPQICFLSPESALNPERQRSLFMSTHLQQTLGELQVCGNTINPDWWFFFYMNQSNNNVTFNLFLYFLIQIFNFFF